MLAIFPTKKKSAGSTGPDAFAAISVPLAAAPQYFADTAGPAFLRALPLLRQFAFCRLPHRKGSVITRTGRHGGYSFPARCRRAGPAAYVPISAVVPERVSCQWRGGSQKVAQGEQPPFRPAGRFHFTKTENRKSRGEHK